MPSSRGTERGQGLVSSTAGLSGSMTDDDGARRRRSQQLIHFPRDIDRQSRRLMPCCPYFFPFAKQKSAVVTTTRSHEPPTHATAENNAVAVLIIATADSMSPVRSNVILDFHRTYRFPRPHRHSLIRRLPTLSSANLENSEKLPSPRPNPPRHSNRSAEARFAKYQRRCKDAKTKLSARSAKQSSKF